MFMKRHNTVLISIHYFFSTLLFSFYFFPDSIISLHHTFLPFPFFSSLLSIPLFFTFRFHPSPCLSCQLQHCYLLTTLNNTLYRTALYVQVCVTDTNRTLMGTANGCECLVNLLKLHSASGN